jgi:hypothetical protein
LSLQGVASPYLPNYGGAGLDPVRGHARAPTKPCEPGVHDGGRARDLPRARGPRILCAGRRIHGSLHGVLRARVRCAITLISLLSTTIL